MAWKLQPYTGPVPFFRAYICDDDEFVCAIGGKDAADVAAKAALIAAAPDLLAACKAAMGFLANGQAIKSGDFVQAWLFNAIAKAEGKPTAAEQEVIDLLKEPIPGIDNMLDAVSGIEVLLANKDSIAARMHRKEGKP